MNTNIHKIERALAFAKEVNLTDEQVKELMAMVLGLVNFKIVPFTQPPTPLTPLTPWISPTTTPILPLGGEIICHNTGDCVGIVPPGQTVTLIGCACSPLGQSHSDNCKAIGINEGRPLQT